MTITTGTLTNVATALSYRTVAASQTAQILGTSGVGVAAIGDYISHITVVPAAVNCGVVTLLDGSTSISVFAGGASVNLATLIPFTIVLGMKSTTGQWKITTGASVSVVAVGDFT